MADSTGCIRLFFPRPGRIILIRNAPDHLYLPQTAEHFRAVIESSVLRIRARDLLPGFPVIDISESIDSHDCPDHQVFLAEDTGADPGFHGMALAGILADGGAAAGAVASILIIASLFF